MCELSRVELGDESSAKSLQHEVYDEDIRSHKTWNLDNRMSSVEVKSVWALGIRKHMLYEVFRTLSRMHWQARSGTKVGCGFKLWDSGTPMGMVNKPEFVPTYLST